MDIRKQLYSWSRTTFYIYLTIQRLFLEKNRLKNMRQHPLIYKGNTYLVLIDEKKRQFKIINFVFNIITNIYQTYIHYVLLVHEGTVFKNFRLIIMVYPSEPLGLTSLVEVEVEVCSFIFVSFYIALNMDWNVFVWVKRNKRLTCLT